MRMELISDFGGQKRYRVAETDCHIIETRFSNINEAYPLSSREVLAVMEGEGVIDKVKLITLHNIGLPNIQGFASFTANTSTGEEVFTGEVQLRRPSSVDFGRLKHLKGEPIRKVALFVLLHEISHIIGISDEQEADAVAFSKVDKYWKTTIKE